MIASEEEGLWICGPGYDWDIYGDTGKVHAVWFPGKAHPDYPNVIASVEQGKWGPAFYYRWADAAYDDDEALESHVAVVRKKGRYN